MTGNILILHKPLLDNGSERIPVVFPGKSSWEGLLSLRLPIMSTQSALSEKINQMFASVSLLLIIQFSWLGSLRSCQCTDAINSRCILGSALAQTQDNFVVSFFLLSNCVITMYILQECGFRKYSLSCEKKSRQITKIHIQAITQSPDLKTYPQFYCFVFVKTFCELGGCLLFAQSTPHNRREAINLYYHWSQLL